MKVIPMMILAWIAVIVPFLILLVAGFGIITDGFDPDEMKAAAAMLLVVIAAFWLVFCMVWGIRYIGEHRKPSQPTTLEAK